MNKTIRILSSLLFLLFVVLGINFSAQAHQIRMSVYVEGSNLEGEIYYVGGGNPPGAGASVELKQDDQILATTVADEEGVFLFESVKVGTYTVRADGGQGHVAFYELDKSEFPDVKESELTSKAPSSDIQCSPLTKQELQKAITKAIRPLREKIDRYEAKTRMHDILGGIGYIFGLFGLFMFVRNRKQQ